MTEEAPMSDRDLHLYEQMTLLALDDERGTVHFGASAEHALAGALLAELMIDGRLGLDGEGKSAKVAVLVPGPTGDALLDECLKMVSDSPQPRKAAHWVSKFAAIKKLKHRAAERLVDRGILRIEHDRILLLFERTRYPERDRRPERELILNLKRVLLGAGRDVDPRTVVLIALAYRTGVLARALDKQLLKDRRERLEKIAKGEVAASAAKEAIDALQAAITVAVIVPTVTSTSS
jgi:hypothetical protein